MSILLAVVILMFVVRFGLKQNKKVNEQQLQQVRFHRALQSLLRDNLYQPKAWAGARSVNTFDFDGIDVNVKPNRRARLVHTNRAIKLTLHES